LEEREGEQFNLNASFNLKVPHYGSIMQELQNEKQDNGLRLGNGEGCSETVFDCCFRKSLDMRHGEC